MSGKWAPISWRFSRDGEVASSSAGVEGASRTQATNGIATTVMSAYGILKKMYTVDEVDL